MRRRRRPVTCILAAFLVATMWASGARAGLGERLGPLGADAGGPLVEDEAYRREGAVTRFSTCLAVADDPAATLAFEKRLDLRTVAETGPDRLLGAAAAGLAADPGFGTLLACARIVAAWHGRLRRKDDGRLEHGAVVLDLALGDGSPAAVEPLPLVRLLTSPRLLPPSAFGGIVVRNARIAGPLLLYNLHLTMPLVFVDVRFEGGDYPKEVFGEEAIRASAISIRNSRFADHVGISNSEICGNISIYDSAFQETLQLAHVEQKDVGCGPAQPSVGLTVQSTRFHQSLKIYRSSFGEAFLVSNDIGSFLMSRNRFADAFTVSENDIGSFDVYGHGLSPEVDIRYNRIANDFFLQGLPAEEGASEPIETLAVVSNRIGGGLGLRDFATSVLPTTLDLKSNHVGNGSEICLPAEWRGSVDLDGSTYSGTLTVGLNFEPEVGALDDEPRDSPCEEPYFVDQGRSLDVFCPPIHDDPALRRAVVLNFTAMSARTLQWHLPLHCSYRWSGFGLTYDLWTPAGRARAVFASEREKWREAAFNAWRTSLRTYEPASLDQMSRYFVDKGAYVSSRHLQYEAKRLNYGPECPPHQAVPLCILKVLDLPNPLATSARADTAGERDPFVEPFWRRAGRAVTLALLWPGGYGARPERALFLLAIFALVFGGIYWCYVRIMRHRYDRFVARFEALPELVAEEHPRHAEMLAIVAAFHALRLERSHNRVLEVARSDLEPRLVALQPFVPGLDRALVELRGLARALGRTKVPGFSQFNAGQQPSRFTSLRYSIDTMLPVIDLHAYSNYYPEWTWMRGLTVVQHILGWWWLTVFIASAAIL